MITFLLMNLIVGTSAFLFTYRILKFNNFVDSLLSLFILWFAQIIFTQLLLGVLSILFIENVILLNLAILLLVWLITLDKQSSFDFTGIRDVLFEFLSNKAILFALTVIVVFASVKIF